MTKGWQAQKQRYLKAGKMGDTKLPRILVVPTQQACMGRQTGATSAILPNCREHARQSAASIHNMPPLPPRPAIQGLGDLQKLMLTPPEAVLWLKLGSGQNSPIDKSVIGRIGLNHTPES